MSLELSIVTDIYQGEKKEVEHRKFPWLERIVYALEPFAGKSDLAPDRSAYQLINKSMNYASKMSECSRKHHG